MNSTRFLFAVPLLLLALQAAAQSPESLVVEAREVETSYPAEAVIEAVKQATVAAQVQGRIVDVRVDAGQKVRAGEVLMRIDEREAVHGVAAAQAGLTNAKANYERSRNLFAQKFISQAALDKAEADYKGAAATAGQAGTVATFSTITAPISGVIAERQAERGEMAAPGRPLLTVFDPKGLRAVAEIPQYKLADLPQKPRARIEFPESGKWLEASRVEILPTADARSHSVRARVYLPEDAVGVIPGMFARVHFVVGKVKKLTLPARAVLRRGDVSAVYVIDQNKVPRLRQVRLGETVANGDYEVLAGLASGEKIATDPVKTGIALRGAAVQGQK